MLSKYCELLCIPPLETIFYGNGSFFVLKYQDFSCLYEIKNREVVLDNTFHHPVGRIPPTNQEIVSHLILKSRKKFNTHCYYHENKQNIKWFIGGNIPIEENTILIEKNSKEKFYLKKVSPQSYNLISLTENYSLGLDPSEATVKDNILTISWNESSFEITKGKYENSSKTSE